MTCARLLFLSLVLSASAANFAAEPVPPSNKKSDSDVPTYGVRSSESISLRLSGEFVRPGNYHVKKDVTLSEIIARAEITVVTRAIRIRRTIAGETKTEEIGFDYKKRWPSLRTDPVLLDGDVLYAVLRD